MADIAIFRINYKSDFILTLNSDAGWMTPFCIKFWTGAPSQAYFVGWDGETYTHCAYDPTEPTKLLVQFDDHHLPIGDLKFQIAYHFTVADFPNDTEDEVINPASIIVEIDGEQYQVMLDFTGETAPEIAFSLPAYANEAQRIANEQARIAAEQQRIANEEARIAAETIRQQNEQQRIDQETARVNEFATLKSQSQAATRDANAAATLANEKAQLAADKAALAQQKAEYAQQQGGYAKDQGDYAKNQGNYAKEQGEIAQADHERAEADHGIAADDHTQAGNDHTRAESDHTRAESDHAAVEVYVDSLGAFDISAYHATGGVLAKYADLTAALGTNGANIPEAIRKGGMSVKFVLSSDNKYVQFRLMSDSFNTTEENWQGVDDEPTAGSNNLVKSGGVYKAAGFPSVETVNAGEGNTGHYITINGSISGAADAFTYSNPILIEKDSVVVSRCKIGGSAAAIAITDAQGSSYNVVVKGKDVNNKLNYSCFVKAGDYVAFSWQIVGGIEISVITSSYTSSLKNIVDKIEEGDTDTIKKSLEAVARHSDIIKAEDYIPNIYYGGAVGSQLIVNKANGCYSCIVIANKDDVFGIKGSMIGSQTYYIIVDNNLTVLERSATVSGSVTIKVNYDTAAYIIVQTTDLSVSGCVKHSNDVPQVKSGKESYDLAVKDYLGHILAMFQDGHFRTKNFDSSKLGYAPDVINRYKGKRISILGDSISTFGDTDSRNENGTYCYSYYPTETCRYSVDGTVGSYQSIKFDIENTYWMKLIRATGMVLGINESWRGSKVSGSGNSAFNYQTRIDHLGSNGTPDVILVYGGTNDAGGGVSLGTFNTENPQNYTAEQIAALPVTTFADGYRTMLIRLMKTYPMAEIVVILPTFTTSYYTITNLDLYVEIIKEACDFFGIKYIDARCTGINVYNRASYMVDGIHPNVAGMQLLFKKIYRQLIFV